jgi:hypothetical protein
MRRQQPVVTIGRPIFAVMQILLLPCMSLKLAHRVGAK